MTALPSRDTRDLVIGVDVGTSSARAGLFTVSGRRLAAAVRPLQTWMPRPDFVEQSSDDVWRAVCLAVSAVVAEAAVDRARVRGISFDATCSLVVLDGAGNPLPVDVDGDSRRNIIVWMDHRALQETEEINAGGYDVLRYVGGRLSPEMETPKLLWIKRHLPATWAAAGRFFDLADFLTFKASGSNERSLCTVVCKWTFLGQPGAWDRTYLESIGIDDAFDGARVPNSALPMGARLGPLTPEAASDLGLTVDCAVGVGIIDAHAGGLGLLGGVWHGTAQRDPARLETALALIGGTSNCHMAVSRSPQFIPGVWGPYFGAMAPGLWLTEGGQSAAGSAIDHAIQSHPNATALSDLSARTGRTIYEILNEEIDRLFEQSGLRFKALLTRDLHVLPYYLGNRSPNADPRARAVIDGLNLDTTLSSQALQYYAVLQAVAYGTRDIIRALNSGGFSIETIFVTGGGTKNLLWIQETADAIGMPLRLSEEPEAVLLGAAMLAAAACGAYSCVEDAMAAMSRPGPVIDPDAQTAPFHTERYSIFREMYSEQLGRRRRMERFS